MSVTTAAFAGSGSGTPGVGAEAAALRLDPPAPDTPEVRIPPVSPPALARRPLVSTPGLPGPTPASPADTLDDAPAALTDVGPVDETGAELEERLIGPGRDGRALAEVADEEAEVWDRTDRNREDDRRRYRRRYRYAGPIPTPAEWEPPEGRVRIALQAGHWKAAEAPDELAGIRGNGTRWEEVLEWQSNLEIAQRAGAMLEELGYEVEILPAVVPPGYRAHLFISIHADGSPDGRATGYRVAAPRRDATGRAEWAAEILAQSYGEATGLPLIPTVTRRMRGYYAFNFRRYQHALHPMTIGVILETGFLTNERDRKVLIDDPDLAAAGIVAAVKAFPLTPPPTLASEAARAAGGKVIPSGAILPSSPVRALALPDSAAARGQAGGGDATPGDPPPGIS